MEIEKINSSHRIAVGASPNEADLAIVSIDSKGNPGSLNKYVLNQYGHSIDKIPKPSTLAEVGFGAISNIHGKPVLFVVTIDGKRPTSLALEENLFHTLAEYRGWILNKTVWIPLMGTGTGGLSLEESYQITVRTINRFQQEFPTEVIFIIALSDSDQGRQFYNSLKHTDDNSGVGSSPAELFVTGLNVNFYMATTLNKGPDRFSNEGIWQITKENQPHIDLVRRVRKNDIIILRTIGRYEKTEKIERIGVVNMELDEGASFSVEWRITDLHIELPFFRKYRATFALLGLSELVELFLELDPDLWARLTSPKESLPPPSNKIAGLLSDTEKGTDYLDIKKDVVAFARVIAASSFEPPLAIALFGKWGSGKSFFMQKLKEKIIDFSEHHSNGTYCEGVVHIHFNAWSYMDANLWASFVSKIFEGLNEYITEHSLSDKVKGEIKTELTSSLTIKNEELAAMEEKKNVLQSEVTRLEGEHSKVKNELENKIAKIGKQTAWNFIKKVDEEFNVNKKLDRALKENKTYIRTNNQLEEIVPKKYWKDPIEAYNQVRSKYTFLQEFFRRDHYKRNLLWLALIIAVIILVPIALDALSVRLSSFNFIIPQATLSLLVVLGAA